MGLLVVLVAFFCLVALVPVVLFLFTYIFRVSCRLCGLPVPGLLVASGKMLISSILWALSMAVLREIVFLVCDAAGFPRWEAGMTTWMLILPVDLVVSSGIHAALTHIRYGKAVEVWFVQRLIQLGILVAVLLVVATVLLVQALAG